MKRYLYALSLLAGLFLSTLSYAYPSPTYSEWTDISRNNSRATAVRELKLVRFGLAGPSSVGVVSGEAVIYDVASDDGVTVALTTTSADRAFAGIAVTAISTSDNSSGTSAFDDIGRRNWGWIIVHGPALAKVSPGGTNGNLAKALFVTSVDSGAITGVEVATVLPVVGSIAQYSAVAQASGGFFLDNADTSSSLVEVFVKAE